MPTSLLDSQIEVLEGLQPDEPGGGVRVTGAPATVAENVLRELHLKPDGGSGT